MNEIMFNVIINSTVLGFEKFSVVYELNEDEKEKSEFLELNLINTLMDFDFGEKRGMSIPVYFDSSQGKGSLLFDKKVRLEIDNNQDIDTTQRTYILNKETDSSDIEFGIYEEGGEYQDYKVYNLEEFSKTHGINKKVIEDFKDSQFLNSRVVTLNGRLGELIHNSTISNSADKKTTTGVIEQYKDSFNSDMELFVKSRIDKFCADNNLDLKQDFEKVEDLLKNNKKGLRYAEDGKILILPISENTDLQINSLKSSDCIFDCEFEKQNIVLLNNKTKKELRVRSSEEPSGENLYMDYKLAGLCAYLIQVNSIEEILTKEKLLKNTQEQVVLLDKRNQQTLKDLITKNAHPDMTVEVSLGSFNSTFGSTKIKISVNNKGDKEELSHKLTAVLDDSGDLKLSIIEGKSDSNDIESFLIKSNSYNAMNNIINKINNNKEDYISIIKNNDIIEEAKTEQEKENNIIVEQKKKKKLRR